MKLTNIENQIKQSLEQREITPSRNLWDAIQKEQHAIEPKERKNTYWIGIAASLALVFSAAWFFLKSESENVQIVQNPKKTEVLEKIEPSNEAPILSITPDIQAVNNINENSSAQKENTKVIATTETHGDEVIVPPSKINVNVDAIKKHQENTSKNALAITDSAKVKTATQRKKYTDANALLFSVENKEIIKQTRDGSNVATIELEKK